MKAQLLSLMMADGASPTEYIGHHLEHWTIGEGFWAVNLDTVLTSVVAGLIFLAIFWSVARKVTTGVPGKFQAFIEMCYDFVDGQVKDVFKAPTKFLPALAMTIFFWVAIMNALDFLPVDLASWVMHLFHTENDKFRMVPTADINTPFAMSVSVFFLTLFYAIRAHGVGGFTKELFTAPFHADSTKNKIILAIPNFLMNMVEMTAKTVSLAMRLFGNMYAGELVFLLIALLGGAWAGLNFGSIFGAFGHWFAGSAWAVFHILIILLQAFIFMVLSIVYIALAYEGHCFFYKFAYINLGVHHARIYRNHPSKHSNWYRFNHWSRCIRRLCRYWHHGF